MTNAGGPPPGLWSDWSREDFLKAIDANMLTPIALMQAVLPGMIDARLGPGGQHHLRGGEVAGPGARAFEHRARRADRLRRRHQPAGGAARGDDQQPPAGHPRHRPRRRARPGVVAAQGIDLEAARAQRAATIPARRYGTPEEFGAACAFLCSVHAGFIVGQNWLLDGGAINSTL